MAKVWKPSRSAPAKTNRQVLATHHPASRFPETPSADFIMATSRHVVSGRLAPSRPVRSTLETIFGPNTNEERILYSIGIGIS